MSYLSNEPGTLTGDTPNEFSQGGSSQTDQGTGMNEDPVDRLLSEDSEVRLPETPLGAAMDNLMAQWNQLLGQITSQIGHTVPTSDHIKELAEFSVRQFKDACLEVNGEFCRVATEWKLRHPEEANTEEVADLESTIQRQNFLLAKTKERIQQRLNISSTTQQVPPNNLENLY
ncbi:Coiled-coil domain-containing protein mdt-28 [Ditylenchus destructor]|nr:Coiled-coil domain-containing protein mdt-28 [Ditylenchus destructor]